MKIAVFGIGGVGGIVGGALAKDHPDTYFYVRGDNLDAIHRNGLKVESAVFGDFTVRPKLASDKASELGVMDVILFFSPGGRFSGGSYRTRAAGRSGRLASLAASSPAAMAAAVSKWRPLGDVRWPIRA